MIHVLRVDSPEEWRQQCLMGLCVFVPTENRKQSGAASGSPPYPTAPTTWTLSPAPPPSTATGSDGTKRGPSPCGETLCGTCPIGEHMTGTWTGVEDGDRGLHALLVPGAFLMSPQRYSGRVIYISEANPCSHSANVSANGWCS